MKFFIAMILIFLLFIIWIGVAYQPTIKPKLVCVNRSMAVDLGGFGYSIDCERLCDDVEIICPRG